LLDLRRSHLHLPLSWAQLAATMLLPCAREIKQQR